MNAERKPLTTAALKEGIDRPSKTDRDDASIADRLLGIVTTVLDDAKAEDIISIDIKGKSALADHMVVASGRSNRHVNAICDQLLRALKDEGMGTSRVEGLAQSDWVLIDAGDVIVHVFRPEVREFYALEKMWSEPDHMHSTVH